MNNKSLKELKKKYNESINQNNRIKRNLQILIERKKILENSPIVKDYIDLLTQIEESKCQILTEEDILTDLITFLDYENGYETNKIYCYAGTFIQEGNNLRLVDKDYPSSEFDRYVDIESLYVIDNPVEDRKVFESENTIIYADNLYDLHDEFIIDCIKKGQNIAVEKVLSRHKKNN